MAKHLGFDQFQPHKSSRNQHCLHLPQRVFSFGLVECLGECLEEFRSSRSALVLVVGTQRCPATAHLKCRDLLHPLPPWQVRELERVLPPHSCTWLHQLCRGMPCSRAGQKTCRGLASRQGGWNPLMTHQHASLPSKGGTSRAAGDGSLAQVFFTINCVVHVPKHTRVCSWHHGQSSHPASWKEWGRLPWILYSASPKQQHKARQSHLPNADVESSGVPWHVRYL